MAVSCEYIKFSNSQKSFSFLSNAPHILKLKFWEIKNTVRVPSTMKLTKNLVFLHYFSKFMGILIFVLKYMYISLLLKMINGFPDQKKSWSVPLIMIQFYQNKDDRLVGKEEIHKCTLWYRIWSRRVPVVSSSWKYNFWFGGVSEMGGKRGGRTNDLGLIRANGWYCCKQHLMSSKILLFNWNKSD